MSLSITVAGMPRATRRVPGGQERTRRDGGHRDGDDRPRPTATGRRAPSTSDTTSAAAAVSTDHPTRLRLHATDGSPCTWSRTRRMGGSIIAAAGRSSPMTPRNTQCQLSGLGDDPRERRPDDRRDDPGGGEPGEHPGAQVLGVEAADDHVEGHDDRGARQAVHEAPDDEHLHVHGRAGDHEPDHEEHRRGDERRQRARTVGPVAGDDHADDARRERHGEREREQRLAVEVAWRRAA